MVKERYYFPFIVESLNIIAIQKIFSGSKLKKN
jgi:hypothetical protein